MASRLSRMIEARLPRRETAAGDLTAGLIAAVLMVPQAMAYAMVAGLPPVVGLYGAVLPPVAYALLGTSRGLSVGPTSVVAIMTAGVLADLTPGADPVTGAVMLAGASGVILLAMGLLRMGFLANFLSLPVLTGFTSGAAVVIIAGQLGSMFGLRPPPGLAVHETLAWLAANLGQADRVLPMLGAVALVFLLLATRPAPRRLIRRIGPLAATLPGRLAPLALVVGASLGAPLFGIDGDALVGRVAVGFPGLDVHIGAPARWVAILPQASLVAFIAYVESVSIGKYLALRRRESIDVDRELVALGGANLASAISGSLPVAGSFSRSVVNVDSGARSQLSSLAMAAYVATALLLLAPMFAYIPRAALSAVIIVAVGKLIDIRSIVRTWRYSKADGTTNMATFVGVLLYGVEVGLVLGVVLSLMLYIWRTGRPNIAVVGRLPETGQFKSITRQQVETWPSILMVRVDEHLYFANVGYIEEIIERETQKRPRLKHLVLIMSGVGFVDSSALRQLEVAVANLREAGITFHLAEVKGPVLDRLKRTRLFEHMKPGHVFPTAQAAVSSLAREEAAEREIIPI